MTNKWLTMLADRLGYMPKPDPAPAARDKQTPLAGASFGRLTADWLLSDLSVDEKIRQNLRVLRMRARDLATNNPFNARFNTLLQTNVVGPHGLTLQMDMRTPDGKKDKAANELIEATWSRWGRRQTCMVDGRTSLLELQQMAPPTVSADGELILRKRVVANGFNYAVQAIDADHLDHQLNKDLGEGRQIRLGIEYDANGAPAAYWFTRWRAGDLTGVGVSRGNRWDRIPADEIIHSYIRPRFRMSRGIPWVNAALLELRHMGAGREAAIIAMRMGAAKTGFLETDPGADPASGETDESGAVVDNLAPGEVQELPPGRRFVGFDPGYPNNEFAPFMKAMLLGVSASWAVTYAGLTGDMADVNLSSMRHGSLMERDSWRMLQAWESLDVVEPVFAGWVPMAILTGQLPYSIDRVEEIIAAASWQGRGWDSVDPLKDAKADEQNLFNGATSRKIIAQRSGRDWREIMDQQLEEQQYAWSIGLALGEPQPQDPYEPAEPETEGGPPRGHLNGKANGHDQNVQH